MDKPRIIIADAEINFVNPIQLKFAEEFFDKVDLEIITDEVYFDQLFSTPQRAGILIVSEEFYSVKLQRHEIAHVFVMTDEHGEERTADLNVTHINKYTNIKMIYTEIMGKSADVLKIKNTGHQETQVILVCSAAGGVGKTTVSMGICASLTKNYKKVLYINAARLQCFHHLLENKSPITDSSIYTKLLANPENPYADIKHVIRQEVFNYLPPFKTALQSMQVPYSIYERIITTAKRSGDFDFIVVDTDVIYDEDKANLMNMADRVMIVTTQSMAAVTATNLLVSNIDGSGSDKYIFVCCNFDKDKDNALISPSVSLKFRPTHYVDHFRNCERMGPDDLSREDTIQQAAFLII